MDELSKAISEVGEEGREAQDDDMRYAYLNGKQTGLIQAWSIVKQYEDD